MASIVPTSGLTQQAAGTISRGRQRSPWAGGADGSDIGSPGGGEHQGRLRFDVVVSLDGYAWWYLDALSDDGRHGITVIAFIGSVFSPYYAWARRHGRVDPLNHCALNVALYGPRASRWSMTERGAAQVSRDSSSLTIGPSSMRWTGSTLEIEVDEICAPLPRRLRGRICLTPGTLDEATYSLEQSGSHRWTPYAPCARVEVMMREPDIHWSGTGYFDHNAGEQPLEDAFERWTWSRASLRDRTIVLYDTQPRSATARTIALQFAGGGPAQRIETPTEIELPRTRWRLPRQTRADAGQSVRVVKTLEDAPFYSRSVLDTQLCGVRATAMHETLSLERFRSPLVQCMLPFRMPRRAF